MHKDIKDLMGYENLEKKHKNIIKSVARVNKIALTLQKTLDLEKGGEIAKNLDHLYQHIRYAVIRVHDDHDFTFLQSAEKVTASINEGWSKMSLAAA
jgi:flagellar protein FliS